ncbi:hypothetical protein [Arthrobacter sp. QXT-31]|uniref:hypothetical protein n=1 Tax=Arthrobacter sp. QXT-31 TaxID=1357915 RepID=UPI001F42CC22|nr:hypothetical protein [Arthrobacter sp. QXT-31]
MTEEQAIGVVQDLTNLAVGDVIEAWHEGRCYNRGKVLQTIPSMGMFWILDTGSGTRKLVDFESLLVRRLPVEEPRTSPSVA